MAEEAGERSIGDDGFPAALTSAERVIARDREGRLVENPWNGVTGPIAEDFEHLAHVHAQDRPHLARAWARATATADRLHSARAWVLVAGVWELRRYDYLSRLDDLGVVFVGITILEPTAEPPPATTDPSPSQPASWSILRLGPLGQILRAEGTVEQLYGLTAAELEGTNGLDLVYPDDHEQLLEAWTDVHERGSPGRALRQRVVSASGAVTWVLASIGRPDAEGAVTVHDLDITDQLDAEESLRTSEARFRQIAADLPTGVFVTDATGRFAFTNSRCDDLVGSRSSLTELIPLTGDGDWRSTIAAASGDGDAEFDCRIDADRVLRVRCQHPLPDGTVCGVIEDVTTSRRWRDEAVTDDLTGLANRLALTREIERRIQSGDRSLVSFIDLDGFKSVNDRNGHDEGDRVLRRVASALRGLVRDSDVAGRWGGDEFILLIDDLPPDARSDLRRRVDHAMIACGAGGASVGFTRIDADEDVRSVIHRADRAMYEDKRRDRETSGTPAL